MLGWTAGAAVLALALATGYETVDALGLGDSSWLGRVNMLGFIALLVSVAVALVFLFARRSPAPAALLAPAAGLFLVSLYFSYDSYYGAGNVRRFSEQGIPGWWIAVVALVAVGAGVLTRRQPRVGALVTAFVPFVVFGTVVALGNN